MKILFVVPEGDPVDPEPDASARALVQAALRADMVVEVKGRP
jgi:hypothetical protein